MMARFPALGATIACFVLVLGGCYSPRYDWESPVEPEWRTSEGLLVEPYWRPGDDLLEYERISLLVTKEGSAVPERKTIGYVKHIRMQGDDGGHVVRFVEDLSHVVTGAILPNGRTIRYTEGGAFREVGDFGYSDKRQYHFAIMNILNIEGTIDTSPWDGRE